MAKKKVEEIKKQNQKKDTLFAFLATFLSIIGFLIAILTKKEDKYVMYYAKQSLVIFLVAIIAGAILSLISWIPIIGWIISFATNILILIAWFMSWINALSGEMKPIPIISDWTKKINL